MLVHKKNDLTLGLLLAMLLAGPALAASPWENIANALMARKAAQNVATSITQRNELMEELGPPPVPRLVPMPALREVPDEIAVTSAGQRQLGSAATALASLILTSGTAVAENTKPAAKAIDLGRESEENETMLATNLFKNKEILRLLGSAPRFIYNPDQRPDPMVVPWVRRAAIYKELSELADKFAEQGQYDKSVELYQRILDMKDPRYSGQVQGKLAAIAQKQNSKAVAAIQASQAAENVELPAWVHDNTTGVIVSPGREMCLVGDFLLHVGDNIPSYPDVKVTSIAKSRVVYQIKNKAFEVVLNNN